MRSRFAYVFLLLCPFATGCGNLFSIGTRNLLYEANLIKDNRFEHIHDEKLAHQAWQEIVQAHPDQPYSIDYACGFKAGFVDFLYAGGCGQPPALPPKRYRRYHGMRPEGCQALMDWYAGFRHGAAEARASGLRRLMVVPLPPAPPHSGPPGPPVVAGPVQGETAPPAPPASLPMPRKQPPPATPQAQATPEGPPLTITETEDQPAPVPAAAAEIENPAPESVSGEPPSLGSSEARGMAEAIAFPLASPPSRPTPLPEAETEVNRPRAAAPARNPSPMQAAPPAVNVAPTWRLRKWGGAPAATSEGAGDVAPAQEKQP
jgi:hypothetical protein